MKIESKANQIISVLFIGLLMLFSVKLNANTDIQEYDDSQIATIEESDTSSLPGETTWDEPSTTPDTVYQPLVEETGSDETNYDD